MQVSQEKIRALLDYRLKELKIKNPAFSIRAFAKRLNVSPGTLSLVILGRRKISPRMANHFADRLNLSPSDRDLIFGNQESSNRSAHKSRAHLEYTQLADDQFNVISEWIHFAILNLIKTRYFENSEKYFARRLGVPEKDVHAALDRLQRLGLITTDQMGRLKRTQPRYKTTDHIASLALKKSHHETLNLAEKSLWKDNIDIRDFTWITFPLDLRKLEKAKELIRKFQDEFLAEIESDADPTEVYRLSIQMFPLTKAKKEGIE